MDFDSDLDDVDLPPDASTLALPDVDRMLRAMRSIQKELDTYQHMHQIEVDRLAERYHQVCGPLKDRLDQLEQAVTQFGVKTWVDFGKTSMHLPNGSITSRKVSDPLTVDSNNETLREFVTRHCPGDTAAAIGVTYKVFTGPLRSLLDQMESDGLVVRAVRNGEHLFTIDSPDGEPPRWSRRMEPGEVGVYVDGGTGEIIPGITWEYGGDLGSGRNFTVKA